MENLIFSQYIDKTFYKFLKDIFGEDNTRSFSDYISICFYLEIDYLEIFLEDFKKREKSFSYTESIGYYPNILDNDFAVLPAWSCYDRGEDYDADRELEIDCIPDCISYVVEYKSEKFLMLLYDIGECYSRSISRNFSIISYKGNKEKILELVAEYHKFKKAHNVWKNRCVFYSRDCHGRLIKKVIDRSDMSMNDIWLNKKLKKQIQEGILDFFDKMDLYKKFNVRLNRGAFLCGPPGNGKTTLGRVLMDTYTNLTFFWVMSQAIENTSDIASIYRYARIYAPSIVFFEDVGPHVRSRKKGDAEKRGDEKILNEFLQQLSGPFDNTGVMTIMTSNMDIDEIDEAILRPGRIEHIIKFPKPAKNIKTKYIMKTVDNMELLISDEVVNKMVEKDFSYAQIDEVFNYAKCNAIDRDSYSDDELILGDEDFIEGIQFVSGLEEHDTEKIGFRKYDDDDDDDFDDEVRSVRKDKTISFDEIKKKFNV